MTSIAINSSAPQANTTNASSSSTAHARTPSISGQSTSAAVPANAPAARALSYANAAAAISKKPPTGPGAASSSNTAASSQVSGGVSGQHARSASTTSVPVNGSKIQPAVPQIGNSGNSIANGASTPYSGGQHSRKPSIAAGPMPNGASRNAPNIKFGGFNETGSGPQQPGTAIAAGSNLTAPVANNPRASSPSPSAAAQPVASGGVPSANTPRPIQFGDTTPQQRPLSLPSQPHVPQGPGSMASRGHNRHDSAQSSHTDSGPAMPHGRGMQINRRGGAYNPQFQNQSYGYGRGGGYQGPSQQRNGPTNMGGAPPYPQQQYPNSPRQVPRSPALAHVQAAHHSPSMGAAVPTTSQLYPPAPHGQPFIPGSPYQPVAQMYQDPSATAYYPQHYQMTFTQPYAQTSPRPHFAQATPPYNPYAPQVQAQPMSRSSSANVSDMHVRPPSSIGQHPQPPMTPQPPHMVSPPQAGTPGPAAPSPFNRPLPPKKPTTRAVEIKNPDTGMTLKIEKAAPSPVVASTPVIVSSPSPAHGRASSRPEAHSRSTSRSNKTTEEKRQEMRDKVALQLKRAEEEEKMMKEKAAEDQKRKDTEAEAERLRKEEKEKLKAEAEAKAKVQAEEDARREAEERERAKAQAEAEAAAKEAAEKKAAEEKALKEAEEQAQREADEKAAKEAEEAKAKADAEAEASKVAKAMVDADKTAPSTPIVTPVSTPKASTPDSDAMPPPKQQPRSKPSPLNLQIKTNEPGPPSAALTALRSARPVENLKHLQYPEGIQSPNPALNPMANTTKFKYDKEFLMQFQTVFTEKPSVDWDQKIRDTVGDSESARPGLSRPTSQMGPRSTSSRGSNSMPMQGTMGSFGSGVFPKPALTSMERFNNSPKPQSPMNMINSLGMSRPGGLNRSGSSTSLSGSASNASPQSPRTGNRSARSTSKRGAGGAGGAGGSPMERSDSRQQPSQPTIPLADVKPLPVSANRWTPRSVKAAASSEPAAVAPGTPDNLLSPEMVQRKVKAALNKMTPEKFDKISDQILEITGQSKHESDGRTLRQVIQLTFEKATDEAHWASMYAKFCKRMLETMDPSIKDENIKDKTGAVVTGGNLFRKYLLNRCQEEFERGWKVNLPPAPEGVTEEVLMLSDEYYIAAAAKRRGLGLVQFIGELFKLNMLTERIMNECVRKLLDFEGLPEDETVESLTKLLRTIGSQLDNSEKSKPMMDLYFQRINSLVENKDLNSRMRFMLMDIIDLRKKGWESKETNKGPKTIQEVHEEALKAQQEKEAASRANRGNNRPQGGRGDARSFSSGGGGYGMHPPGNSGGTVNPDDLRRLGARNRQTSSGPGTSFGPTSLLGPRGSGSRRGLGPNLNRDDSSPSSRTATPPAPASTSSPNMFSLLNEAHADGNDATSPPPSNANSPQVSNAKPVTEDA